MVKFDDGTALVKIVAAFCRKIGIFSARNTEVCLAQTQSENNSSRRDAGVIVACSGGVDSLTLADVFFRLQKEYKFFLAIAHFEHGIRGDEAKADALFVKEWAATRNIPFFCEAADVPSYAENMRLSLETAARELRYAFLRRTAVAGGCRYIATAHHADDQAETVLMHLLRGAGLSGLEGMSAISGDIIRPFINVDKADLVRYAKVNGLSPRTDTTNFSTEDSFRNKVRLELLPLLKAEYNPNIVRTLERLVAIVADENEFLRIAVDKVWQDVTDMTNEPKHIKRKRFAKLPVALARDVLRRFFAEVIGLRDVEFVHIEAVRRLIVTGHTGNALHLPHGLEAKIFRNSFFLRRAIENR